MAKISKSISFKNATIDTAADIIIETSKDDIKTYRLSDILKDWNGIEGISFNIKIDEEIASQDVDGENT